MIASSDVQFFNHNWQPIGTKQTLADILSEITRVPQDILTYGLDGHRPCIARTMSWAANRTTTRVQDRAYSLMGLLDVNMPMLLVRGRRHFTAFSWRSGPPMTEVSLRGTIKSGDSQRPRCCMSWMPAEVSVNLRMRAEW